MGDMVKLKGTIQLGDIIKLDYTKLFRSGYDDPMYVNDEDFDWVPRANRRSKTISSRPQTREH